MSSVSSSSFPSTFFFSSSVLFVKRREYTATRPPYWFEARDNPFCSSTPYRNLDLALPWSKWAGRIRESNPLHVSAQSMSGNAITFANTANPASWSFIALTCSIFSSSSDFSFSRLNLPCYASTTVVASHHCILLPFSPPSPCWTRKKRIVLAYTEWTMIVSARFVFSAFM